jgi:hypothetical protein
MSGRITVGFVDFTSFSSAFDLFRFTLVSGAKLARQKGRRLENIGNFRVLFANSPSSQIAQTRWAFSMLSDQRRTESSNPSRSASLADAALSPSGFNC